ncbi:MAG TPA: gamma-glutamyl-gamma-aminobutyrate hydrolase family protein [Intrasporangium sp.]|uniref:gamma-glutamyl-gamma-aminobutyrate hydrolase family protein n=1 Tax=Intrasporangium sp. TaxID=1925024 RepID=UPI002D7828CF|nr:gamma-glutamyl-gamma-aminobutyrate hydrolase family protein [Intrasporangium sp.]HET7397725.1 gamma-glutamyl-gamma-aminobutyrate hydrolase family protein [Intrasporangium sp.]
MTPARGASRPVIGITSYVEHATRGDWVDVPSALLPHAYVRKVEEAGGIAVLIPPRHDGDESLVRDLLQRLDAVILAGGVDVAPELYAAQRHPSVQVSRPDRDTTEISIARVTREVDLPVLGICRGMQVMAVAAGGTLVQHLPEQVGHTEHAPAPATYGRHPVETAADSLVARILGPRVDVATYHHQSVQSHPGYVASAWAPDGTLEAMEDRQARFRLGVQWHPEHGSDPRLFEALVAAAAG